MEAQGFLGGLQKGAMLLEDSPCGGQAPPGWEVGSVAVQSLIKQGDRRFWLFPSQLQQAQITPRPGVA
ncbi:MAG: hypothetical protein VKM17_04755 [Cyanobacteriota bacterium]|nr:hypothetical protein [Cyanobacteriota bacterium]